MARQDILATSAVGWLAALAMVFATLDFARAADFDPRAFGAKGDGVTKDTAAIQRAIDACVAAGGGRVVLTNGTFLTAPIVLGSGVELHLAKGATLLGSADLADYPNRNVEGLVNEWMPRARNTSLVFAAHARNVSITGEGTIDANGRQFVVRKQDPNWKGWEYVRKVDMTKSMPRVVFFFACRGVRVTDVTLTNGPAGWSYWVHDCDDVLFDRCKVKVNVAYPNNDGIHINSSRDVIVRNCDLETGDDSIVVRANNRSLARAENPVCERVVVSNCVLRSWASGIRIAWANDGEIRNCVFRDLVMRDTTVGIAFVLPLAGGWNRYDYGREATSIHDLLFENIEMKEIYARPIYSFIESADKGTRCAGIRDITFRNVRARALELPLWRGRADVPTRGIVYDRCRFEKVCDAALPGYTRHGAFWDRHPDWTEAFVEGFTTNASSFGAATVDGLLGRWRGFWAERRGEIDASIDRVRKADCVYVLKDDGGRPLANAEVEVRQVSSAFNWGCGALCLGQLGAKNAAYEAKLSEFFNLLTTTFTPDSVITKPGTYRFDDSQPDVWRRPPPDRVLAFARRHGLRVKGQPLCCDHWHPAWAKGQTKAEAEEMYRAWFKAVADRYGKRFWSFDVVNEAFCARGRNPSFPLYGGDEAVPFVDWAYREAAKVFPKETALAINMGIESTDWNDEGERYFGLCKRIVDSGTRLDAIGFQFHLFGVDDLLNLLELEYWHPDMLRMSYEAFATLGKPLYISEITIPSTLLPGEAGEELQAAAAVDLYRFWFSRPEIHGITWWNLMDGAAFAGEDGVKGALLDDFAREKAAYQALRNLITREFNTSFRTKTDAAGRVSFRGFRGTYSISFRNAAGNGLSSRMVEVKCR